MIPANRLKEQMETEVHQRYYKQHCEEDPFPLDGSDWSRLVALRLQRIRHPHCCTWDNFLTRLHSEHSPLEREHQLHCAFMGYWFLNPYVHYPHANEGDNDAASAWSDVALRSVLPEILQEAEKQWVRPITKAFEVSPYKFWIDEVSLAWHDQRQRKKIAGTSASVPLLPQMTALRGNELDPSRLIRDSSADEGAVEGDLDEDYLLEVENETLDPLLLSPELTRRALEEELPKG